MRMPAGWMAASMAAMAMGFAATVAAQDAPLVLRDLESKSPKKLTKDELTQLMPGAKISRIAASGSGHIWTNDTDGTFIVSSDNRGNGAPVRSAGRAATAPGKWHISEDGRYCVLIEWRGVPTEEWCRYILKTSDGAYYATKSESVGTERVFLLEIKK